MPLCRLCSAFKLETLSSHGKYVHSSLLDIFHSALSCSLCALMMSMVAADQYPYLPDNQRTLANVLKIFSAKYVGPVTIVPKMTYLALCLTEIGVDGKSVPVTYLDKLTYPESVKDNREVFCTLRLPERSSSSRRSLSFLHSWLEDCEKNHEECQKVFTGSLVRDQSESMMPSRVIHIRGSEERLEPRLLETKGLPGRSYTALSHCWGPPEKRPLITTRGNYLEHQHAIPWVRLPKTFQEAMFLTRRLGIEYIWIDSLCIIQDDPKDWESEAAIMGKIYEQSYLTIAASGATDSTEGCFVDQPYEDIVQIPAASKDGTLLYVRHLPWIDIYYGKYDTSMPDLGALASRAWITQEWLLPRRIVYYRRGQMVWRCRTKVEREDTGNVLTPTHVIKGDGLAKEVWQAWELVLNDYTARKLTRISDRLPALQGLIERVSSVVSEDTCYFGHWVSNLPSSLAWVTNPVRPHHLEKPSLEDLVDRRPAVLAGLGIPTWSCASVSIQAFFPAVFRPPDLCLHVCDWEVNSQSGILSMRAYCTKIPCMTVPQGEDESMCHRSFYRYSLQDASLFYFPEFRQSPLVRIMSWPGSPRSENHDVVGMALLDEPETSLDSIYGIPLFTDLENGRMAILLVRSVGDVESQSNCFRRVGAGLVATRTLFEEYSSRTQSNPSVWKYIDACLLQDGSWKCIQII